MKEKKKPGVLTNLIFNIVIPVLLLTKFSKPQYLGPTYGLAIAVLFPLGYGVWEFIKMKKLNIISVVGFVGILITGIVGLLKLPPFWYAVKEAGIPFFIGLVVLISELANKSLMKKILFNDDIMEVAKVNEKLIANHQTEAFSKILKNGSLAITASFFLSSIVNFLFARHIVTDYPPSEAFNKEIMEMKFVHMAIVGIPLTIIMIAVFYIVFIKLKKFTNLEFEEIFKSK